MEQKHLTNTMYDTLLGEYGPIITVQELSLIVKYDPQSIYRLVKNGTFKLRPIQLKSTKTKGDSLRFSTRDVAALLSFVSVPAAPKKRGRPKTIATDI